MGYLFWKQTLYIDIIHEDLALMQIKYRASKIESDVHILGEGYALNETAIQIITLVDGTKTFEEIVSFLSIKYNEEYLSVEKKVTDFFHEITDEYHIDLETQNVSNYRGINIKKGNIYPRAASIELTDRCNLSCLHCYGMFSSHNHSTMPIDNIKRLLEDLSDLGVLTIELTGGECTLHPNFKEILLYALKLNFVQISILTNGVVLSDEIISILKSNRNKMIIQIDLHSLKEDYFNWFTNSIGKLNIVKSHIKTLANANIRMRVVTIATKRNIDELENIADWLHDLGVLSYAISPVTCIGRAAKTSPDLLIDDKKNLLKLETELDIINRKYPKFISNLKVTNFEYNCGCVTRQITISSKGDIKICIMDNYNYGKKLLGNVFEKPIKNIYDTLCEYINAFYYTSAPKYSTKECCNCKNVNFCTGCMLRGLIKAGELNNNCGWYENALPKLIKEKIYN